MDAFDKTVVIAIILAAAFVVYAASASRTDRSIRDLRLEATAAGLAEFYVNPATGETEFKFISAEELKGTP